MPLFGWTFLMEAMYEQCNKARDHSCVPQGDRNSSHNAAIKYCGEKFAESESTSDNSLHLHGLPRWHTADCGKECASPTEGEQRSTHSAVSFRTLQLPIKAPRLKQPRSRRVYF